MNTGQRVQLTKERELQGKTFQEGSEGRVEKSAPGFDFVKVRFDGDANPRTVAKADLKAV